MGLGERGGTFGLLVGNSGGTNISVVDLGARTNPPAIVGEVDRFQTQDLKVFVVEEEFDPFGAPIYPVEFTDYSDRPQFIAQAASGRILFSTRPAIADAPGTIREFNPVEREIRFFIDYADREAPSNPQIQVVNADSVKGVAGNTLFKICDHDRGFPGSQSCEFVPDDGDPLTSAFEEAENDVAAHAGWDALVLTDLVVPSIGLQDTTFVTASGDREFIAFGEGDTPGRPGRIIMYRSATQTITNSLQVNDLTENAAQQVFGLALDNDGLLGVGRGEVAFFFGPDQDGGPNTLRLLGTNSDIQPTGTGAALHPDHDQFSVNVENERLAFLGSGDARIEIVDTHFFDFKRGELVIRDPIVGPLRITRGLSGLDPANVVVRL
ncbi:MAG: hypothetical protein R3246_14585, partial [Acidimicrobiia bacterium]|nr:hypothetical protein [Acidimicrobiia bacterium]